MTSAPAVAATAPPIAVIALDKIDPSPLNRKCDPDDQGILSLAASIEEAGLINPITVRAVEGRYEIVCGERRWLAHRKLGRGDINAIVIAADERHAQILRVTENLQRQDLSYLESGDGVAALLKAHDNDVAEVASRLGYSPTWVRRRAKLPDLIDAWRAELDDPDTPYAKIRDSVEKLEEIALLPEATQQALLDDGALINNCVTTAAMRRALAGFFRDLAVKPWTKNWEAIAFSGSSPRRCYACAKRSDKEASLFTDLHAEAGGKEQAFCLDPACWQDKIVRWCKYLIKRNPAAVLVWDGKMRPADAVEAEERYGAAPLESWRWREKAQDGYARESAGLIVGGARAGVMLPIWLHDDDAARAADQTRRARLAESAPEPDEEAARREKVLATLEKYVPEDYADLVACCGADQAQIYVVNWCRWFGLEPLRHYREGDGKSFDFAYPGCWQRAWKAVRSEMLVFLADFAEGGVSPGEEPAAAAIVALLHIDFGLPSLDAPAAEGDDDGV